VLAGVTGPALAGQTYYVSPTGSDSGDGLSPQTAWNTVSKVNATAFAPGSQILFQSGGEWHESLAASSSGTAAAPIVYGAYGDGPKPKFWGSDVVSSQNFFKLVATPSTYLYPRGGAALNALLVDHQFLHDASVLTQSTDSAVNRDYVDAHPNTWTYYGGNVYVNTGGIDPRAGGHTITAAARDDVVYSNGKDNLIFRDLSVAESAKMGAGYSFRVQNSNNVQLIDDDATGGGKHAFGVINTNNFVGNGLHATSLMPDQGYGGATAFVSYSDYHRSGDTSAWINCTAEQLSTPDYLAFYMHGEGLGDVTIKNLTARDGAGLGVATEAPTRQQVKILGGSVDNATLELYGSNVLIDGVHVTGKEGGIGLRGNNNTVQNVLMTGVSPSHSQYAVIRDGGLNNVVQFNTLVMDPNASPLAAAVAMLDPFVNTRMIGNVFDVPSLAFRDWFDGRGSWTSDYNLFSPTAGAAFNLTGLSLAQLMALGYDQHSLATTPVYLDPLNGDYTLTNAGIDRIAYGYAPNMPLFDFLGDIRPQGSGYDVGAFEAVPEPSGASALLVLGGGVLVSRRGCMQRRR
jgi:hypothetical protein